MKKTRIILLVILILSSLPAAAQERWRFDFLLGVPYNFSTPLSIEQEGYDDINLGNADYESKPFVNPIYYSWRLGRWKRDSAWELELLHQKLHLQNKLREVDHFEVSHGYNLITINRAWQSDSLTYRLGAGIVLAHPQTTIRGKTLFEQGGVLDTGYYIAGPTLQVAVDKKFPVTNRLYIITEGKLTASHAIIPISGGQAKVPNLALHGLLGLGYKF
ncbi:hypothetical protein Halha_2392 [Halobacteroides halobius DSM 5150]|uniref:Outer membrane protein beta-barrel domain-containing protein n=1 Tax=Halobacteroides halobius (strain ATCC 35273 / DSM 5150 / MD-1) TaxID=748449 RepID=L0KB73_HALHC|nr:hypothetical protein [Halobacteroides halobius]AGB42266.1 hypothetical protein Halha_2392 [Halobacteroides halobius DSM 5150]